MESLMGTDLSDLSPTCLVFSRYRIGGTISLLRQALALVDQALTAEDPPEETRRRVAAHVVAAGLGRCHVEPSRDLMTRLGIATL
jgi:hypothetical protein